MTFYMSKDKGKFGFSVYDLFKVIWQNEELDE